MDIHEGDKYFPYSVALELTLACNMRCLHCGSSATEKNRENNLTNEDWFKVIEDLAALGAHCITLSGGEPFMYPGWREIVKYIVKVNPKGVACIISNGSIPKEEDISFLKEAGLHQLALSLDGNEKVHDYIRQYPGSFAKLMDTIKWCKKYDLNISTVVSINKHNFGIRKEIIDIVKDAGVKACQVQIVNSFGRAGKNREEMIIEKEQYVRLIDDVYDWQKEYSPEFNILAADSLGYCYGKAEAILNDTQWTGCSAGCYSLGIEANGGVKGCLSIQDDNFISGNIKDKSIIDIWNDDELFAYTRKYDASKMTGKCAPCKEKETCKAGCLGMAHSLGKTIYENPYCYKSILGK